MIPALPTGTVTFLLTDVQGSTRAWLRDANVMGDALARHDELIEQLVAECGGQVVRPRGEGDSRFAVFIRASDGVVAACAIQLALLREPWRLAEPLRVRIGVHTGEADLRLGDYYGAAVNHCARLRSAAHGGQVLVSAITADLVREALSPELGLRDLGPHELKDLERSERIYQLLHPELPAEFPPLTSVGPSRHRHAPLTTFIGREHAVAEVTRLVSAKRLVTLTGSGGVGKTRLALEVATHFQDDGAGIMVLVELAALNDPALVPNAVAAALRISEQPGRPLLEVLSDALLPTRLLLVLDNCEHLLSSCAELADRLLHACPTLQVLATSREALAISGETVVRVPSLSVPQTRASESVQSVSEYESVQLFVERAQAVLPDFSLTESNAAAIVNVCRRLDGIPLALELAAARVPTLSIEEISERVDSALRLLRATNRVAPLRQQTLRATLDWSYGLLEEPDKVLFERLTVFAGGWTLKAAEVICAGGDLESERILDALSRLVEKSLAVCDQSGTGSARYRVLETVRQYGQERLTASGARESVAEQHARYFLDMAEAAAPHLFGPHDQQYEACLNQLELEHDNLRAALRWLVARGDVQQAQRLGGALRYFWFFQGHLTEGRAWLAELAAMSDSGNPSVERARVLAGASILAVQQGDFETTRSLARQAEMLWNQLGNDVERGLALFNLGSAVAVHGDHDEARALLTEAVRITRAAGERNIAARTVEALNLYGLSELAFGAGDYAGARGRAEEAMAIARELRWTSPRNIPQIIGMLGEISLQEGDLSSARAYVEDSLVKARAIGWPWGVALALIRVAHVAIEAHDIPRTITALMEAFAAFQPQANRAGFIACLECLAHLEASRGNAVAALRLAAEATALRKTVHVQASPTELRRLEQCVASARAELGEAVSQAILAEVRMIPVEQIIAEGLSTAADTPATSTEARSSREAATPLTQRELEVVALVAQGRTNLQIAEKLVLSIRTVESHVRNAMAKLHLTSRVSLATWAMERRSSQ